MVDLAAVRGGAIPARCKGHEFPPGYGWAGWNVWAKVSKM